MKTQKFYGWWIVIALTINMAVLGPAAVTVANLFQTPVISEFNISSSSFAINNLIVLGLGIFVSPLLSKVLNGKHFKTIMLSGILIYGLGIMGYSVANNIFVFYLFSVLVSYGYVASTFLPASILINNWFIDKRGSSLSITIAGLGIGGFILSPILGFVINTYGWRMGYIVLGLIMLAIALPVTFFLLHLKPEMKGQKALESDQPQSSIAAKLAHAAGKPLKFEATNRMPFYYALLIGTLLVGVINNGGMGQFPPAISKFFGSEFSVTIISVYALVGVFGKLLLGVVVDKLGTDRGIKFGNLYTAICLVICFVLIYLASEQWMIYLMAAFYGIGQAVATVMPPLLTGSIYQGVEYSKAYGYVQAAQQLGMAFGSLLVATIADISGSYALSWIFMIILSVAFYLIWTYSKQQAQKYQKQIS